MRTNTSGEAPGVPVELHRPELERRLSIALMRPITVLRAPAGYGKSTALRHALSEWRSAGISIAAYDDLAKPLWRHLSRGRKRSGSAKTSVVVLDQLHSLPDSEWDLPLAGAILALAPGQYFALAVRGELPPAVLSACRQMGYQTLDSAVLRFSLDECIALVEAGLTGQAAQSLGAEVHQLTGGWPAAVTSAVRGATPNRVDRQSEARAVHNWERYLYDEVLQSQPASSRELLCGSVLLGDISGELCDAVLGRVDSHTVIGHLTAQGLLNPLPDEPGWFSHHPMLAETLRDIVLRDGRVLGIAIQRRAARWHIEKKNRRRAVGHLLALGDFGGAADLVLGNPLVPVAADLSSLLTGIDGYLAARSLGVKATKPSSLTLSVREAEVLECLATGSPNREIARQLHVSLATVKAHVYRIFRKLRVTNRTAAVVQARRRGLIP